MGGKGRFIEICLNEKKRFTIDELFFKKEKSFMKSTLRKCEVCGEYTFKEVCERCGRKTMNPNPPRFSPKDPYGKYRRMMKYGRDRSE
jgi:H/ACA ribonucleoprotein complex subunit 3